MKIAVLGAGAIGCLVAGYLKLEGEEAFLVGHADSAKAIRENGLEISGVRGNLKVKIDIFEKLSQEPDLVILATKTQDIEQTLKDNLNFIKSALVVTTQNGVQADNIVSRYIPEKNIVSSIVMFGATYLEPGKVAHNFEGNWIMSATIRGGPAILHNTLADGVRRRFMEDTNLCEENNKDKERYGRVLSKIFPVVVAENIRGMKYLKIFVNANNCIAAILGKSMQESFADIEVSKISIAIWKEGLEVINKAGIKLESLPDFPLERLIKLTAMPIQEAAKIFSGIMLNLSKEPLYGSILQSIKRNRSSEIDYINGEFVSLAKANNFSAPLNEKLTAMVHQVEKAHKFFSKEELIVEVKDLLMTNDKIQMTNESF